MSDTDVVPAENSPVKVESGNSLSVQSDVLRMMMEGAWQNPRRLEKVQEDAYKELEIVPGLAARAYYSIPYNDKGGGKSMVEGPSIKAAMTLARNWHNCFNDGRVVDEDKSNYYVNGIFFDLESNLTTIRQIKVSKFYKPKGSQGVVPRNADMMNLAVQAGISKAVRNAILASLPDWLVQGYFNKAKQLVINPPKAAGQEVESIQARIQKGKAIICKELKVTPEEMENYLTENGDCYEDDNALLTHLLGLYNGIKEGQTTVEAVFRPSAVAENPGMPQEKK
jgi:hypothetical protein